MCGPTQPGMNRPGQTHSQSTNQATQVQLGSLGLLYSQTASDRLLRATPARGMKRERLISRCCLLPFWPAPGRNHFLCDECCDTKVTCLPCTLPHGEMVVDKAGGFKPDVVPCLLEALDTQACAKSIIGCTALTYLILLIPHTQNTNSTQRTLALVHMNFNRTYGEIDTTLYIHTQTTNSSSSELPVPSSHKPVFGSRRVQFMRSK